MKYERFDGRVIEVLDTAAHPETGELYVTYKWCDAPEGSGPPKHWIMPQSNLYELVTVEIKVPKFKITVDSQYS